MDVQRKGNLLIFPSKIDWTTFRSFNSQLNELPSGYIGELTYDFSETQKAYPNGMVPIIATSDKRLSPLETFIEIVEPADINVRNHFDKSGWFHYLNSRRYPNNESVNFRYSLHRFTEDTLDDSINYILEWLLRSTTFAEGIHPALEWMIGELSGNVADHAEIDHGWMQVNLYSNNNRISAVICDSGIGIPTSMRAAFPELTEDMQAIRKAIEKSVTSKKSDNQGNGIAGTIALARETNGHLLIASGQSHLIIDRQEVNPVDGDESFLGTIIELLLDIDRPVDILSVFSKEIGHRRWSPISYLEMQYENDAGDLAPLKLKEQAPNFVNRRIGAKLRNLMENLLVNNNQLSVVVDFEGVDVISSSFADEVFGKLATKYSVWEFSQRIRGINV